MDFKHALLPGRLIQRYKRFLADVDLEDGRKVTAHCANPGAMLGLNTPGLKVWVEPADNPKRKLQFDLQLVELAGGALAGINTAVPNRIVGEALRDGRIPELAGYSEILPEQRYGTNSRVDFLLRSDGAPDCYVEVKNVHLMRDAGLAEFPDSVTSRGAKHLAELANVVAQGARAVMLYVIQREDGDAFSLASDIDPTYAKAFEEACAAGVEALAIRCQITPQQIVARDLVPVLSGCQPTQTR